MSEIIRDVNEERLLRFKKELSSNEEVSELVMAIFSQLENPIIEEEINVFQQKLYILNQVDEYKSLLNKLEFNNKNGKPYSVKLGGVIMGLLHFELIMSGVDHFLIKRQLFKKSFEKFDEKTKEIIQKISNDLSKQLKPLIGI
jgi:translation initiation factor 2B subunit (eIF-2B alpha/beta/delta family)